MPFPPQRRRYKRVSTPPRGYSIQKTPFICRIRVTCLTLLPCLAKMANRSSRYMTIQGGNRAA